MGLYDIITFEYQFPDPDLQFETFQTKDLDSMLKHYVVDPDGMLLLNYLSYPKDKPMKLNRILIPFDGKIRAMASTGYNIFFTYTFTFERGRIIDIHVGEDEL